MDNNRDNQYNPNLTLTGPGHQAGFYGNRSKTNLDNHANLKNASYGKTVEMDSNRSNQCNPNHTSSGPGRTAGYHGSATKADLDNHSNQNNPNNSAYASSRGSTGGGKR